MVSDIAFVFFWRSHSDSLAVLNRKGTVCAGPKPSWSASWKLPRRAARCRRFAALDLFFFFLHGSVDPSRDRPGPRLVYAELMDSLGSYLEPPGYGEMFTAAGSGRRFRRRAPVPPVRSSSTRCHRTRPLVGLVGDLDTLRARLGSLLSRSFLDEVVLVPATAARARAANAP